MHPRKLHSRTLALAIAAALLPSLAAAQDTPSAVKSTSSATQLDAVTVTAQRREETLQKTPVTISVVGAEALEHTQVMRIDDLKFAVPNILIEPNTATSNGAKIFLRGVGSDDSMFTTDPAVAIYIDDVYIPRQTGAMFDLYDVERIEVLRGPQGTLYGRNATGGAIRYITKQPNGKSTASVSGQIGNLGRADLRATIGGKLGDSVDFTAAALSRNRDGYMRDVTNNRDVNDQQVNAARIGLGFPVGERSRATVNIDRIAERSGPVYATGVLRDSLTTPGGLVRPPTDPDRDYYTLETDLVAGRNDMDQTGVALTLETDYDRALWRNIVHYRDMESVLYLDVDATAQMRYNLFQHQKQSQRGFESQLISQGDGPFNWVGGVFAFNEKNDQPTRQDNFVTGPTNHVSQDTNALAAYFQGSYRFAGGLGLTGGARYSYEKKDIVVDSVKADGTPAFFVDLGASWSKPDWKVMLDYPFTSNVMGYTSIATGFKSGGFNGRGNSAAGVTRVDEETVLSYEAGVKTEWLDNRVRLNVNYFRNAYDDLQLTAYDANGFIVLTNASDTLMQGFEGELQALVTRDWQLHASVGTLDAEYRGYSDLNRPMFDGRVPKNSPKLQWTLGTTHYVPLESGRLVFSAQAHHSSKYYQTQDNSPLVAMEGYTLVDARLAYEPAHGNWMVAAWSKNLTDEEYITGGFDIASLGMATGYMNVPRTYGVDFKYRFW